MRPLRFSHDLTVGLYFYLLLQIQYFKTEVTNLILNYFNMYVSLWWRGRRGLEFKCFWGNYNQCYYNFISLLQILISLITSKLACSYSTFCPISKAQNMFTMFLLASHRALFLFFALFYSLFLICFLFYHFYFFYSYWLINFLLFLL